jgi:hypothetical protein
MDFMIKHIYSALSHETVDFFSQYDEFEKNEHSRVEWFLTHYNITPELYSKFMEMKKVANF